MKKPSYEEYKKWIQSQGIKSLQEIKKLPKSKFPPGFTNSPYHYYTRKGTWISWSDLLGLARPPTYDEYKKWIQSQGIKTTAQLKKFPKSKFPSGYHRDPYDYYKRGNRKWVSFLDLFGTEKNYVTYEEYKKWIMVKGIKSKVELVKFNKSNWPSKYPKDPVRYYKIQGKWKGWPDLFGRKSPYLNNVPTYEEYKKWIMVKGIKRKDDFGTFDKSKLPLGYPKNPDMFYRKQRTWKSWGDFLGTGRIANQDFEFLPYEEAEKQAHILVKKLGIRTPKDWVDAKKAGMIPDNLPANPSRTYAKKYKAKEIREWISFNEARKFVHSLKLKSNTQWQVYLKSGDKPKYIPASPAYVYLNKGWKGWRDWLGIEENTTERKQSKRKK